MISKTLENIEKDIKYLKEIANEEHFKKVEEMCNEVNKRNNELQERINKARAYINRNCILSDEWTDLGFCNFAQTGRITYKQLSKSKVKELLDILKGEE